MNELQRYQDVQVQTASPVQIILLLLDRAIHDLRLGQQAIRAQQVAEQTRFLTRALRIVSELSNVLDMERGKGIAVNLRRLYDYIQDQIVQTNRTKDAGQLDAPVRCLLNLREGWASVCQATTSTAPAH